MSAYDITSVVILILLPLLACIKGTEFKYHYILAAFPLELIPSSPVRLVLLIKLALLSDLNRTLKLGIGFSLTLVSLPCLWMLTISNDWIPPKDLDVDF